MIVVHFMVCTLYRIFFYNEILMNLFPVFCRILQCPQHQPDGIGIVQDLAVLAQHLLMCQSYPRHSYRGVPECLLQQHESSACHVKAVSEHDPTFTATFLLLRFYLIVYPTEMYVSFTQLDNNGWIFIHM